MSSQPVYRMARLALAVACALPALAMAATTAARSAPPAPATPPLAPCAQLDVAPVVNLSVGKSTVLRPRTPITRILLGNPENSRAARPAPASDKKEDVQRAQAQAAAQRPGVADVDVLLLGPTEVFLLGKSVGSTNVVMLDRSGACTAFDVVVGMDTAALQAAYAQLMPQETGIKVRSAFDSVVLSGVVSDNEAVVRATDIANAYVRSQGGDSGSGMAAADNPRIVNMLEVGAPQQVMLQVRVAEVSKALLDKFGIDFARAYVPGDGSMIRFLSGVFGGTAGLAGQVSGTNGAEVGGGAVGSTSNGTTTGVFTGQAGTVTIGGNEVTMPLARGKNVTITTLNMQKTDGLVKILAEPSVMAISGQSGSFLAGGKIFIPLAQTDTAGTRTITLEEREFGVSVKFTPTVLSNGRINLKVRPEVSELNANGVTITGGGVNAVLPSFSSRRAETTVQLLDGQSFAIGGLIKNNTTTNIKAFPFLGEIPVLGALFRSTEFQTDRSELVFVITPRLVKPLPADYKLPTDGYTPPTRKELIFDGKLEGRRSDAAPEAAAAAAPVAAPAAAPATPSEEKK
ncbi:MAG TPA: type II and III secretion system protein family protein [Albitalea sp.]|nr:type II and III secretion system protein family protein [Albitalea sp.]